MRRLIVGIVLFLTGGLSAITLAQTSPAPVEVTPTYTTTSIPLPTGTMTPSAIISPPSSTPLPPATSQVTLSLTPSPSATITTIPVTVSATSTHSIVTVSPEPEQTVEFITLTATPTMTASPIVSLSPTIPTESSVSELTPEILPESTGLPLPEVTDVPAATLPTDIVPTPIPSITTTHVSPEVTVDVISSLQAPVTGTVAPQPTVTSISPAYALFIDIQTDSTQPLQITLFDDKGILLDRRIFHETHVIYETLVADVYTIEVWQPGHLPAVTPIMLSESMLLSCSMLFGDFDGNRLINADDLALMKGHYQQATIDYMDIDNDSMITLRDLNVVARNLDKITPVTCDHVPLSNSDESRTHLP
ncbi:MAG: hypothetical protein ACPG7F_08545 [Aggregatilineales bacterium]